MRVTPLLRELLGLKHTRILSFRFTETELVVAVKPAKRSAFCSGCGGRAPRYDRRRREWRHLDVCGLSVALEYETWRVECPRCGVTAEMVPWAAAGSGFTHAFEEVVAFLAQRTDKTTVSTMMAIAWKTVGLIIERVSMPATALATSTTRRTSKAIGMREYSSSDLADCSTTSICID